MENYTVTQSRLLIKDIACDRSGFSAEQTPSSASSVPQHRTRATGRRHAGTRLEFKSMQRCVTGWQCLLVLTDHMHSQLKRLTCDILVVVFEILPALVEARVFVQHHAHSLPVNTRFTCQSSLQGNARLAASTSAHTQKACMLSLSLSYTQPATSLSKHTLPISLTCPCTLYLSVSPVHAHFTYQSHLSLHTLHISHTCQCTLYIPVTPVNRYASISTFV